MEFSEKAEGSGVKVGISGANFLYKSREGRQVGKIQFKENTMMRKSSLRKLLAIIGCMVLIAAMALVITGCGSKEETAAPAQTTSTDVKELGTGAITFDFTVEDLDGTKTVFKIHTDETTVGAALLGVDLLKGEDGPYGLYVHEVNGIRAVYEEDGSYWAFYVNGEYGMTGVDMTDIEPDTAYAMVKTKD